MVTVLSFVMDACFHESEAGLDVDVEWGSVPRGAQTYPGRVSGGTPLPEGPLSFLLALTSSFSNLSSLLF